MTPLTDEHIIPLSLGGNTVLEKASCKACEDITKKFEGIFTRGMIGNYRIKFNSPSRRMKQRPKKLNLKILQNQADASISLPVQQHPAFFCLPLFPAPEVVRDLEFFGIDLKQEGTVWIYPSPEEIEKVLPKSIPMGSKIEIGVINTNAFVRCLAKMAYCNCIYLYGREKFYPLILSLIRGETCEYSKYIGKSVTGRVDNNAFVAMQNRAAFHFGKWHLITTVQLCFLKNGPAYDVVVGEFVDQTDSMEAKGIIIPDE